jgi:spermidine synthase
MAILWQKTTSDTHYEIRTAGHSRRLYTNGVCHSQHHPKRTHSGGMWSLLMLPAFFRSPARVRRVLVLGVGGGSVIHLLQRFVAPVEIIGIELNRIHLQVAHQFFGIKKNMAALHCADAVQWLKDYDGPAFDMIIDDLFGNNTNLERAVPADTPWCKTLLKNLNRSGILVMNFIGTKALRNSACIADPGIARHFKSVFQLSLPAYENAIGVFLGTAHNSKDLRANLKALSVNTLADIDFRIRAIGTSL